MNRLTLRTNVLSRRSWHADVDAAFVTEVNTVAIDGAIKRLASEVPEAFIPATESVYVYKDDNTDTLGRKLAATADPWVLSFGLESAPGGVALIVDGTADGITFVEVLDPLGSGVLFTRQCREFWLETVGPYAGHYLVSLDKPWRNSTDTGMEFRLYQPAFYLRDDVTDLVDGAVFDTTRQILVPLPAGNMRADRRQDYRGQWTGRPEGFTRGEYFQMPAPNRAPSGAVSGPGIASWVGPEPLGTFTYRYTYVWGKKDFEVAAPGGGYDPVWESAPSPESASVPIVSTLTVAQLTTLTNIDFQQGFGTPATTRKGHSGWRKRIYRARSAVTAGGGFEQNLEAPNIYFFLAEVDGETTSYTDDGSVIPDFNRRMPESRGYYAWAPVPHQDTTYRIDLRVYRRPLALQVDSDAPAIHPDFDDMLEDLVLVRLCEMDKSPEAAAGYELSFQKRLEAYRAKEASPVAYIPARPWRPEVVYDDPYRYRFPTSS